MCSKPSKGVFLDVDPSIVESKLQFTSDPDEEEFNKIFKPLGEQHPSKLVKPFPGFCIKTREVGSERKFFVNICHTDAIPAPKDISEKELSEILESDEISEFRVPMSIGEVRTEKDKKNEEAKAADVAVHPSFFNKIEQRLKDKYGIVCNDEKIILKNRKAFGTLQMHRIQQREVDEKMKSGSRSLIEEITGSTGSEGAKPLIETISSNSIENRVPEYRLFRRKAQPNCLVGEFKFPDVESFRPVVLLWSYIRIYVRLVLTDCNTMASPILHLTPLDFNFWDHTKDLVYEVEINTGGQLQKRVTDAANQICKNPEMLNSVY
ncbi:hypothetical protein GEV33_009184 [Tenebrio molitor]|uniref:PIH1 N-terminal domain-containing protein n=1 Tax=Tenebrio molitor TaxID=7067 RepID=A0A8J6L8N8_TENMO|nr:hypothetical protein GEV33_009184 [Tenebrio molitor]